MTRPVGMFPFAPLQEILTKRLPEIVVIDDTGHSLTIAAGDQTRSAEVLGVSRQAVHRWTHGRLLSPRMADHCATRLTVWPNSVWDDWDAVHERLEAERQDAKLRRRHRTAAKLASLRTVPA